MQAFANGFFLLEAFPLQVSLASCAFAKVAWLCESHDDHGGPTARPLKTTLGIGPKK